MVLPRHGVVRLVKARMTADDFTQNFGASRPMHR